MERNYPPLTDVIPCPKTVATLLDLYTGHFGEVNAILQYINQYYIINSFDKHIANEFYGVARDEQEHKHLIGNAIVAFGGITGYANGQNSPNNFCYINEDISLIKMLDANIQAEHGAIRAYEHALTIVNNHSLRQILMEIRDDELDHLAIFTQIKNTMS